MANLRIIFGALNKLDSTGHLPATTSNTHAKKNFYFETIRI
jgi:hypothetical protein